MFDYLQKITCAFLQIIKIININYVKTLLLIAKIIIAKKNMPP